MKLFLTDQKNAFDQHLMTLIRLPVMVYNRQNLKEKITDIHLQTNKAFQELNLDFLFDYKIFPSNILTFKTQWEAEKRKMRIGDTILQQAFLPPIKGFSQKIIFGVRINSVIHNERCKGFSYETLEGHAERGESTFTVEQQRSRIIFKIHTFSEPASTLAKLAGPLFALPYQAYCTRKALENVKQQIARQ